MTRSTQSGPRRVGGYRILSRVHEGEFSVVYRCRDAAAARDVAIKGVNAATLDPADAHRRLLLEGRIRATLLHPHIAPLYRLVRTRGGPLLVSPWLDGSTLQDRLRTPLPLIELLAVVGGVGHALDALHARGWYHGDLSPANVMLVPDAGTSSGQWPMLIDFGTARGLGEPAYTDGTLTTTPFVTAPELVAGGPGDGRSDIYSLGVLLFLMLTGSYPFVGESHGETLARHRDAPVPSPASRCAIVGPATEVVVLRTLAKDPATRFTGGAELAQALRTALQRDGLLEPEGQAERSPAGPIAAAGVDLVPDEAVLAATGEELERFAAGLSAAEQMALHALLQRASTGDARALTETMALLMHVFAPPAALLGLEESGAALALPAGPRTAAQVAAIARIPEHTIAQVLDVLAAAGLLGRDGDRFALPGPLASLYRTATRAGAVARPVREAARFWANLPRWTATGDLPMRSDQPDGALYATTVGTIGAATAAAAAELAKQLRSHCLVPPAADVLDVGAGSAVWSLAIVTDDGAATVTALDRPLVLETTRVYAQAAGAGERLRTIAGDWRDAQLPGAAFDLAILANICHLESGSDVATLLRRSFGALRPGGVAVIVDTIPERRQEAGLGQLLQGIQLGMRSPGGVHDRAAYEHWLSAAGFAAVAVVPLQATNGHLTALIARRPDDQATAGAE